MALVDSNLNPGATNAYQSTCNSTLSSIDSSLTGILLAQGSSTSGQKGLLNLAAVTTNAPSYSTGQSSPLSLDTSGLLRVSLKDTPQNTTAFKVDGSAVTQPTSLASLPALAAGTNRIGSARLVDSADADLTSAKAAQTSRFVGVQKSTDAGRTMLSFYAIAAAAGSTGTETAITLTKSSGTSATATAVSFVVTSGKRFRITHISVATRGNATATIQTTTFSLRINTGGAVTTSSTPIVFQAESATPATASAWDRYILPITDGYEILGDGTLQWGITAKATYSTNAPTWDVNIIGFEY